MTVPSPASSPSTTPRVRNTWLQGGEDVRAALAVGCPRCGVGRLVRCHNGRGYLYRFPHLERVAAGRAADEWRLLRERYGVNGSGDTGNAGGSAGPQ